MFTLPETEQEVFDIVYRHLMKQMRKCTDDGTEVGTCMYRGLEGMKCAAGVLIPDDNYDSEMENCTWMRLVHEKKVPEDHHKLIARLQRVHDVVFIDKWEATLQDLAAEHQLKVPELRDA